MNPKSKPKHDGGMMGQVVKVGQVGNGCVSFSVHGHGVITTPQGARWLAAELNAAADAAEGRES